jgi:hypothetical protein
MVCHTRKRESAKGRECESTGVREYGSTGVREYGSTGKKRGRGKPRWLSPVPCNLFPAVQRRRRDAGRAWNAAESSSARDSSDTTG